MNEEIPKMVLKLNNNKYINQIQFADDRSEYMKKMPYTSTCVED